MSQGSDQGNAVAYVLSTWVYLLHTSGTDADDDNVRAHCAAIDAANDSVAANEAGEALVRELSDLIGDDGPDAMTAAAQRLYGARVSTDLGTGDRDARTARIRKYQFTRQLPWLARIYERMGDGQVVPGWLLVERMTDQVAVMDPNPWNDIDEERDLPVQDFHVLWELDACSCVYLA